MTNIIPIEYSVKYLKYKIILKFLTNSKIFNYNFIAN